MSDPREFTGDHQPLGGLAAVPVGEIQPSPNNPRENLTGIDELAVSIRENGLIQPIILQRIPGQRKLQILAGHRRFAAVLRLGWPKIPAIIRRDMLPDEELLLMLVENGQRAGLDPIEEARALSRLKSQGLVDKEIGLKIGRSQNYVSGRLALLTLPVEEQEELRAGFGTITGAVIKARTDSGRVRPGAKGKKGPAHLATRHPLAVKVASRCRAKGHKRGQGSSVGGVGCGECWESVIRADEREQLNHQSNTRGRCVLCDTTHDPDNTTHLQEQAS